MIHYIVTDDHSYTIGDFLRHWETTLVSRITRWAISIEMQRRRPALGGTYIFSDLDRYSHAETVWAIELADQIRADPSCRLLNHPGEALGRLQLLRDLYADGANSFTAHAFPLQRTAHIRLPALVRRAAGHDGPVGDLIMSQDALRAAGEALRQAGADDVIAVEFRDTRGADGLYRKYSCFRIGDAIVPRHLLFSRSWITKTPDILTEALAEEESRYVKSNPHEAQVRAVFDRAKIQYGRIDYALRLDGSGLEVWEINTNPYISRRPNEVHPLRRATNRWALRAFQDAMLALDSPRPDEGMSTSRSG
jgi:hypothetical protein